MRGQKTWHSPAQMNFPLPLNFGLGQLSTHKALTALLQIFMSTIHKVYPPICRITAYATVSGDYFCFYDLIQMNGA
jgi:hypothetical protein